MAIKPALKPFLYSLAVIVVFTAAVVAVRQLMSRRMSDEFIRTARRALLDVRSEAGEATITSSGQTTVPRLSAEKVHEAQALAGTADERALAELLNNFQSERAVNNAYRSEMVRVKIELYRFYAQQYKDAQKARRQGFPMPILQEEEFLKLSHRWPELLRKMQDLENRMGAPGKLSWEERKKIVATWPRDRQDAFYSTQHELQQTVDEMDRIQKIWNGKVERSELVAEVQAGPDWKSLAQREDRCAAAIDQMLNARRFTAIEPQCSVDPKTTQGWEILRKPSF